MVHHLVLLIVVASLAAPVVSLKSLVCRGLHFVSSLLTESYQG